MVSNKINWKAAESTHNLTETSKSIAIASRSGRKIDQMEVVSMIAHAVASAKHLGVQENVLQTAIREVYGSPAQTPAQTPAPQPAAQQTPVQSGFKPR